MSLEKEIKAIQSALIHDEDYRQTWIANVACAVMVEMAETDTVVDWDTRQKIGERFVQFLCAGHPDDSMSQFMEAIGH